MMPRKKPFIETERKRNQNRNDVSERDGTFWTFCPFCYYVYEYEIVYQGYCLRCQNCSLGFQGVPIDGPLPQSVLVAGKERYYCHLGFLQLYYVDQTGVTASDRGEDVGANSETVLFSDRVEDILDFNYLLRRGITNNIDDGFHQDFEEQVKKKVKECSFIDEDDSAKQVIEPTSDYVGEITKGGIENGHELLAEQLKEGRKEESEQDREGNSCGLEFYVRDDDDDDIYVGLTDI